MRVSQCGVEVTDLRALLADLGLEQQSPTEVWEDTLRLLHYDVTAEYLVNREQCRSRWHIDTRHKAPLCPGSGV